MSKFFYNFTANFGEVFSPWKKLAAEKKKADLQLDQAISLAIELAGVRHREKTLAEENEKLRAENETLRRDMDSMSKDLLLAARSESMAVERAWHAGELVRILKARLDAANTPPGG